MLKSNTQYQYEFQSTLCELFSFLANIWHLTKSWRSYLGSPHLPIMVDFTPKDPSWIWKARSPKDRRRVHRGLEMISGSGNGIKPTHCQPVYLASQTSQMIYVRHHSGFTKRLVRVQTQGTSPYFKMASMLSRIAWKISNVQWLRLGLTEKLPPL